MMGSTECLVEQVNKIQTAGRSADRRKAGSAAHYSTKCNI